MIESVDNCEAAYREGVLEAGLRNLLEMRPRTGLPPHSFVGPIVAIRPLLAHMGPAAWAKAAAFVDREVPLPELQALLLPRGSAEGLGLLPLDMTAYACCLACVAGTHTAYRQRLYRAAPAVLARIERDWAIEGEGGDGAAADPLAVGSAALCSSLLFGYDPALSRKEADYVVGAAPKLVGRMKAVMESGAFIDWTRLVRVVDHAASPFHCVANLILRLDHSRLPPLSPQCALQLAALTLGSLSAAGNAEATQVKSTFFLSLQRALADLP